MHRSAGSGLWTVCGSVHVDLGSVAKFVQWVLVGSWLRRRFGSLKIGRNFPDKKCSTKINIHDYILFPLLRLLQFLLRELRSHLLVLR